MILDETAYFRIYLNKTKRLTLGQQVKFFIAPGVCSLITFIAGLRERRKPMKSRAAQ
jgi:hypothetical protein